MVIKMHILMLKIENQLVGHSRFKKLGSTQHRRGINRLRTLFVALMGPDCENEFFKHLTIQTIND